MKVLKFGGTSVGSVNSILSVKKIVEAVEEPVIVVVSAFGGITDKLLTTSLLAAKGDVSYEKELSEIISRHLDIIEGVISDNECRVYVQKKAMELLDELSNILKGVYLINDLSPKTSDTIVSYGERLSSMIVAKLRWLLSRCIRRRLCSTPANFIAVMTCGASIRATSGWWTGDRTRP